MRARLAASRRVAMISSGGARFHASGRARRISDGWKPANVASTTAGPTGPIGAARDAT